MQSKVSFIILCIDEKSKIDRCLRSISKQDNIDKEVIIVSNKFAKEDIKALLNEEYKLNIVFECNKDIATNGELRNIAMDLSTGDYLCFMHENDMIENDSIKVLVEKCLGDGSDIAIGRVLNYDGFKDVYEFKKVNKSLVAGGVVQPIELINDFDMYLYNKIYDKQFIMNNNIRFAETNYYDYQPFVLKALILATKASLVSKPHYIQCLKFGLESINNPNLENKIDINQLKDMSYILKSEIYCSASVEYRNLVVNNYIQFVLNRGIKYVNVTDDKVSVLMEISSSLEDIDISKLNISDRNKKLLSIIKSKRYEEFFKFLEKERIHKEKKKNYKVYLSYTVFSKLYDIAKILPVKKNTVLFLSHSPGMDGNFEYINNEISRYNEDASFGDKIKTSFTSTKVGTIGRMLMPLKLARKEFVILCENVPFFQHLDVRKDTKIVQSWHAAGAFKKFGYSTSYMDGGPNPFDNKKMNLHLGYTYATVSSKDVAQHYANAFRMDVENVIPVGVPRADFFFDKNKVNKTKEEIYKLYPILKNKKVILYAPTFRGFGSKRKKFDIELDFNKIAKNISDEYVIALKLHPSVEVSNIIIDDSVRDKVINISEYKDANDILTITDLLITDYSSIIFDYSLLNKPMLFYAYDLDEYRVDRDFYYDYEDFVPGPIAKTNDEIIKLINENNFDLDKVDKFCSKFFVAKDGNNSKRFVEEVILKNRKNK